MKDLIKQTVSDSIAVKENFFSANEDKILSCAAKMADRMKNKNKLLLFGNGGSAADSQHLAAEFVNRFLMERRPLPAVALTCDTSIITAVANDYAYEDIFLKQIQAIGSKNDIALGITTSGNSPNVIKAIAQARKMGLYTVGFCGAGGKLKEICDTCFCVDSPMTPRIQEVHILLGHIICDLIERIIFNEQSIQTS